MRIYTKSGDAGETGLIGGSRVKKNDPRICAIGEVDELNAHVGVLRTFCKDSSKTDHVLSQIQNDLFSIGATLADPKNSSDSTQNKHTFDEKKLEAEIDRIHDALPELKNFILPGGTQFSAQAHLARAVCRRAERAVVSANSPTHSQIIIYLNRLSDLLFMMAREDLHTAKVPETPWVG